MKIDYEDKIDIEQIKDDFVYEVVARFVDNEAVLSSIISQRKWLGIKHIMIYREAKRWLKDPENLKKRVALGMRINLLKEKLDFDYSFDSIMLLAILAGKVTEQDYRSAYCIEFPPENMDYVTDYIPRVAIVISPDTRIKEVKELMNNKVQELFKEQKSRYRSPTRKREEVRNARKWYWLKKKMTYPQLTDYVNRNGFVGTQESIKKAVINYRRKLK